MLAVYEEAVGLKLWNIEETSTYRHYFPSTVPTSCKFNWIQSKILRRWNFQKKVGIVDLSTAVETVLALESYVARTCVSKVDNRFGIFSFLRAESTDGTYSEYDFDTVVSGDLSPALVISVKFFQDQSAASPDLSILVCCSKKGHWDVISTTSRMQIAAFEFAGRFESLHFTPFGTHFVILQDDILSFWDTATWETVHQIDTRMESRGTEPYIDFDSTGEHFVICHKFMMDIWNFHSSRHIRKIRFKDRTSHSSAFFVDDGRIAVGGFKDGCVAIFDVGSGEELTRWQVAEVGKKFYVSATQRVQNILM